MTTSPPTYDDSPGLRTQKLILFITVVEQVHPEEDTRVAETSGGFGVSFSSPR